MAQVEKRLTDRSTTTLDLDDPHIAAIKRNPDVPEKLQWNVILSIIFLSLGFTSSVSFGFILPTSIIVQIGVDLGDATTISWIASGWSVASSISFGIAGSLSDTFGRRWVTMAGQVLTVVGAIVAATASSTLTVAAGSTIIGFGCGMIFVAFAGIPELLPYKWRGAGLACTEFAMIVPWNFAATYFAYKFLARSWRWCYYGCIMYAAVAFIGCFFFYYPPSRPQRDFEKTRWEEVKEIDYIGIALYSTGLTILLVGLSWAGTPGHPWASASVIAPIVLGFVTFMGTFVYDFKFAKNPFFPFRLFRQIRQFTLLLVLVFVAGVIFYSMAALLPQAFLYMFTSDPDEIGRLALLNGLGQLLGGVLFPAVSHKIKHLRWQLVIAMGLQLLFCILYTIAIPGNRWMFAAFQIFGQGAFGCICYVVAGLHVNQRDLGIASGLIGTFRSMGGSVGNSIFSTILNGVVGGQLVSRISAAAAANGLASADVAALVPAATENALGVPGAFASIAGMTPAAEAAIATAFKEAYAFAFSRVFYSTIPFNVLALIAAFFIIDPSQYMTNHVSIHLGDDARHKKADDDEIAPSGHTVNRSGSVSPPYVNEIEDKA